MEARGSYAEGEGVTLAPKLRVGIGFGRGSVVGASALVDTGADVCAFPSSLFPFRLAEKREPDIVVEVADGSRFPSQILYPSITAGDIRERGVASVILPGGVPILGRSFLNRLALRLTAEYGLVHLRTLKRHRVP